MSNSGHCPIIVQTEHASVHISAAKDRDLSGANLTSGGRKLRGVLE